MKRIEISDYKHYLLDENDEFKTIETYIRTGAYQGSDRGYKSIKVIQSLKDKFLISNGVSGFDTYVYLEFDTLAEAQKFLIDEDYKLKE